MIVVLPFFQGDVSRLSDLLVWIRQLGGVNNRSALLVADANTQWSDCMSLANHASEVFWGVKLTCTNRAVRGWPLGSNTLFKHAAFEMKKKDQPWLWLEPDAIPLKPTWKKELIEAYQGGYLGRNGVGVYPPDTHSRFCHKIRDNEAWDVTLAREELITDTDLIQFDWGALKKAPTFTDLSALHPRAVLFHRNKDGTLITLLRQRLFPMLCKVPFTVVLSFFNGDAEQAHQTLEWIARLGTPKTHPILLNYQAGVPSTMVAAIIKSAHKSFTSVHRSEYRRPPRGTFAPTVAFIHAAHSMQKMGKPWLWMEPDTIPLKPNWLEALQQEYDTCGKPFCGPIVPHRGHMNGTGLYPANTPELIPQTIRSPGDVWDWKMKGEMIDSCHDCSRIFFHTWGEIGGKLNPIEGEPADFSRPELFRQIPESAVIVHRAKYGLIETLEARL